VSQGYREPDLLDCSFDKIQLLHRLAGQRLGRDQATEDLRFLSVVQVAVGSVFGGGKGASACRQFIAALKAEALGQDQDPGRNRLALAGLLTKLGAKHGNRK